MVMEVMARTLLIEMAGEDVSDGDGGDGNDTADSNYDGEDKDGSRLK